MGSLFILTLHPTNGANVLPVMSADESFRNLRFFMCAK